MYVILKTSHIILWIPSDFHFFFYPYVCGSTEVIIGLYVFTCFQTNIRQGDKEEKHRKILLRSLHLCTFKLSALHLVWIASGKLQMGKFSSRHYQWSRHSPRVFFHYHIFSIR